MTRFPIPALVLIAAATIVGSSAWAAPKVVVRAAPDFDAEAPRTFSFANDQPTASGKTVPVTPLERHVRAEIVRELVGRGWTRAADGITGDVVISYGATGEPTFREGGLWVFDETGLSIYGSKAAYEGWFMIAIGAPGAKEPSWQGFTKAAVGPSEDLARRKLEKVVRRLLGRLR